MKHAVAICLCAWLAACGEPGVEVPGEIVAGTSGLNGQGFVPLDDGADVELVPGSQGGFHVWVSSRIQGVAGEVYLEREARRVSDEALILRGQRILVDVPASAMDGWWETDDALPAFMCPSPIGIQVFDTEIRIQLRLTDAEGTVLAEDQMFAVPRCPEGEQRDFCLEICAG